MHHLEFLDEITLLGLARTREKAATESEIVKSSGSIAARLKPSVRECLARLKNSGFVIDLPKKKGAKSSRWQITPSGSEVLVCLLGCPVPKGGTWRTTAIRILTAARELKLDRSLAASVVKRKALHAYYVAKRLGEEFDANTTLDSLAKIVAGKVLGISGGDSDSIWTAMMECAAAAQSGATNEPASVVAADSTPGSAHAQDLSEEALLSFVAQVESASRGAKEGWFGPEKLFIHRAWETWKAACGGAMELPGFKQALLQGLRAGIVELARADFPMGLSQADLDAALTTYGTEAFHFVIIKPQP